ncbi:acyltransferase family protein [Acidocella sp.]|uniref:acyltransferase family protein n=1 Tax=Acidocella sp. TaxID=50710 RepID=UPI003D0737B3
MPQPDAPTRAAPSTRYLTLEAARFIAALFVAVGHLSDFSALLGRGKMPLGFSLPPIISVLFFFVLSGFVIQTAHGKDTGQKALLRYGWRRFCRLFPLYWLSLLVPLYFLLRVTPPLNLIENLTLSPFASPHLQELNPPAWSLRFELTYYLMFWFMLLKRVRTPLILFWLTAITVHWLRGIYGIKVQLLFGHWQDGFDMRFLGVHGFLFLAGMGAAALHARLRLPAKLLWALLGLSLALLIALMPVQDWGYAYPPAALEPLTGLLLGGLILALAGLERGGHLRLPGWCAWLGAMSYPLYLIHASVSFLAGYEIAFVHPHAPRPATFLLFLVLLLAALALAAIIALIDKPFQRLARRLI